MSNYAPSGLSSSRLAYTISEAQNACQRTKLASALGSIPTHASESQNTPRMSTTIRWGYTQGTILRFFNW